MTFKRAAMRWWGTKVRRYPMLVVTYEQLLEWLRTELVPTANPDEAFTAWQKLAYRGNIEDYLHQLDKLSLCFPLDHTLMLTQATQPLGEVCKAGLHRLDMQFGRAGLPYRKMREYIELYLQERFASKLRTLTEQAFVRGGYGKMVGGVKASKGALHATQVQETVGSP